MRLRAVIAIVCTLTAASAAASAPTGVGTISFHTLPIPDETPADLVTALTQDRDGFLWIGTQAGLVRYDGYNFRTYKPIAGDATSLSGAYVRTLRTASDGRVWAGTFADGLSIFDPRTMRFTQLRHDSADPHTIADNRVEGLAEDRDGRMWVATYGGLDRIDPRSGAIEHFRHDPDTPSSLADDRTRGALVDSAGTVWIGSSGGLQRWSERTHGFERVGPSRGDADSLAGVFVSELYEDSRGRIWIGTTESGAAVFDPKTGGLRRLRPQSSGNPGGLSHFWVYGITETTPGTIWIATFGGGIDVVDADSLMIVERLRHDPALSSTIGGDRIGALLRDRSGIVWVGTWGQGIDRHDPSTAAFREVRYSPAQPDGLTHAAVVRALQMQDGTIWVGTNGNGVDIFDREWRRVGGIRPSPRDPRALADGSVTCLAQTPDGTTWVATLDGTLHRRRPGATAFERLTRASGLPGGPIRAMTASGNDLWIASANGLARLDLRGGSITAYHHAAEDPRSLTSDTVESVAIGADGTVWIGSDSGLNALDPAHGTIVRITHDDAQPDSLPANWVPDLAIVGGRVWVGTPAGAATLISWNGRTARFERVASKIRRPPAPVESIIEDADGWVWLGQRRRVNPRTWEAQDFGAADGLDFRAFFIGSRSRTAAGELLFGSPEGLLIVQPSKLSDWSYRPETVLTSVRVDGKEQVEPARVDRLMLPARTRGFAVEVASLDLSAPERNLYRYRLDGFDRDWTITTADRRSLTYTNLAPGSYVLHVEGSNRAQRWSGNELRVAVTVLPAFYQTTWFFAALVLTAAAIVYGGTRLRVRRLEARGRELERIVRERTTALEDAYLRIEQASLTDPLTELHNRRFLDQTVGPDLDLALRLARRNEQPGHRDHICLAIDLDHFKSVNDRFGHAAGDVVLTQAAQTLRANVRTSDYIIRWGGEEFLIVARFIDRAEGAKVAEKLRAAIEARAFALPDGRVLHMTCSVGFATFPFSTASPEAIEWDQIVALADFGLYAAKRRGRNGWVGFDGSFLTDPAPALDRLRAQTGEPAASGISVLASNATQAL